jgi:hypothetical protein
MVSQRGSFTSCGELHGPAVSSAKNGHFGGCLTLSIVEALGQRSDREFGWGGTLVTEQRRSPEAMLRQNGNLSQRSRPKAWLMWQLSV